MRTPWTSRETRFIFESTPATRTGGRCPSERIVLIVFKLRRGAAAIDCLEVNTSEVNWVFSYVAVLRSLMEVTAIFVVENDPVFFIMVADTLLMALSIHDLSVACRELRSIGPGEYSE